MVYDGDPNDPYKDKFGIRTGDFKLVKGDLKVTAATIDGNKQQSYHVPNPVTDKRWYEMYKDGGLGVILRDLHKL